MVLKVLNYFLITKEKKLLIINNYNDIKLGMKVKSAYYITKNGTKESFFFFF